MWEFEERMSKNALKRFPKNKIPQEEDNDEGMKK